MAIKGKGKTRSRRVVAAPPRPPVYVRKPPFFRRRSTLIVLGTLAVIGITFGTVQFLQNRSERELRRRETQAIRSFTNRLTASFPTDRQVIPPDVYFFYQSFNEDLEQMEKGQLSSADAVKRGGEVKKSATAASGRIQRIEINELIPADLTVSRDPNVRAEGMTRQEVTDAQFLIARAFRLYAAAGALVEEAGSMPEDRQDDLSRQAQDLMSQAIDLFSKGYRTVASLKARVGIKTPVSQNAPPG
ncbi:MAG TPA: hypothetical protein VHI54_09900 [Actinomycetota bacterium]|nr:hypothetical protein [Actinomycetota bacterium]